MMKNVCALSLLVVMLFGGALAQPTCDCEFEPNAVCSSLDFLGTDDNGVSLCEVNTFECTKCVCLEGGSQTCTIETGSNLVFIPPRFCEVAPVAYAKCPDLQIETGSNGTVIIGTPPPPLEF
mmetsp:Transcript_6198/g.13224  ORF Transcript_6198/g.13224 Transcript_6198/m.13224 type:complete len:122 (+) Transcript_6198:65-430(+)